ncbi:MAG: hypothetical protein ACREX5_05610, partial [Achromobacter pestifer]
MDEVVAIPGFGFGILSPSSTHAPVPATLVLLNAGLTHRAGPFRSYVGMARHLARTGVDVFRFDLPRVGDGPAVGVSVDAMVAAALDALDRRSGARRYILGGICSAADMAWRIAQVEPRVGGVWLLDGFAHRGRWFRMTRLRNGLRRPPSHWPGMALRLLDSMRRRRKAWPVDIAVIRDWPDPETFRVQAADLLGRGVRILAIYTGGVSKYLLHRRQLDATFGASHRHQGLELEYFPDLDHTLMSPADRDRVTDELAQWCQGFRSQVLS